MVTTESRKLIENEAKFREYNEALGKGFDHLKKTATEQGWNNEISNPTGKFFFICECSDEDCAKRVQLTIKNYSKIHANRDRFVVICGHEIPAIERVIEHGHEYCIVEKKTSPPEHVDNLHQTSADNT